MFIYNYYDINMWDVDRLKKIMTTVQAGGKCFLAFFQVLQHRKCLYHSLSTKKLFYKIIIWTFHFLELIKYQ